MTVKDPVCGMELRSERVVGTVAYRGVTYHFCTEACQAQFEADPRRYVDGAKEE